MMEGKVEVAHELVALEHEGAPTLGKVGRKEFHLSKCFDGSEISRSGIGLKVWMTCGFCFLFSLSSFLFSDVSPTF